MNIIAYYRTRILVSVVAVSVVLFGFWWLTRYQPRIKDVLSKEEQLEKKSQRIRETRQRMVELGVDGIEERISSLRGEGERLTRQVPPASVAAQSVSQMTEAMSAAANRFDVRLHAVQPVEGTSEGVFKVEGFRVHAVGRYHDVGSFLTELLSFERITQLRQVRVEVIPDSLMRQAAKDETQGRTNRLGSLPSEPGVRADNAVRIPEGEEPFNISVVFTLNWFAISEDAQGEAVAGAGSVAPAPQGGSKLKAF